MVAAPLGVYDRSVVDAIGSEAVARLENLFNIYVTQQSAVHPARAILHFWDDQALRERHSAQRAARRRSGIRGGCVALLLCRILRTPSRVCEMLRSGGLRCPCRHLRGATPMANSRFLSSDREARGADVGRVFVMISRESKSRRQTPGLFGRTSSAHLNI